MTKEDKAVMLGREHGYNCCQAVICAYAEEAGMKEEDLFRIAEGFGSGLGCTKGHCGALSAACMMAGIVKSTANLERGDSKGRTYAVTRDMVKDFEQEAGAVRCRDLKGIETGKVLYECEDCVRLGCRLIEKYCTKN